MTPLPHPGPLDPRHHPKVPVSKPGARGHAWTRRHSVDETFTESLWRVGEAAVSQSLGSLGEGDQHLGAEVRALLALVWPCPGPLWGGSWGSESSILWPSEGVGEITASPRLPGCGYRPLGPVQHSSLSGHPNRRVGLSQQTGQSPPSATLSSGT